MNSILIQKTLKPIIVVICINFCLIFVAYYKLVNLFYGQLSFGFLFASICLILFYCNRSFKKCGFNKVNFKTIVFSILLTCIYVLLFNFVQYFGIQTYPNIIKTNSNNQLMKLIIITIIAPISEELIYRGYLQSSLNHLKERGIMIFNLFLNLPITISALVFSLAHLSLLLSGMNYSFTLLTIIDTFIFGVFSGFYREKTDSIYPSIIMHSCANIMSIITTIIFAKIELLTH